MNKKGDIITLEEPSKEEPSEEEPTEIKKKKEKQIIKLKQKIGRKEKIMKRKRKKK